MTDPYAPDPMYRPYGGEQPPGASPYPRAAAEPPSFWDQQRAAAQPPSPEPPPPAPGAEVVPVAQVYGDSTAGSGDGDEDFDAWLAEYTQEQPKVKLWGEWVTIPLDIPLWVTQRTERGDADVPTLMKMIDSMYGPGQAARWVAAGAGELGFSVIIAWSMLRAQGQKVPFSHALVEAEKLAAKAKAKKDQQDAGNAQLSAAAVQYGPESPEARAAAAAVEAARDAGKAPSFGTGAPSRPTSTASTGSPAPGWRA